jgi:hypothetical protein
MSRLSYLLAENWKHECPVCKLCLSSAEILSIHYAQHSFMEKYFTSIEQVIPVVDPVPVTRMPSRDYYTVNGIIYPGRNYPDITRGIRCQKTSFFIVFVGSTSTSNRRYFKSHAKGILQFLYDI